jgi:hypothetical protein
MMRARGEGRSRSVGRASLLARGGPARQDFPNRAAPTGGRPRARRAAASGARPCSWASCSCSCTWRAPRSTSVSSRSACGAMAWRHLVEPCRARHQRVHHTDSAQIGRRGGGRRAAAAVACTCTWWRTLATAAGAQAPAFAQRRAQRVVADAEAGVFQLHQFGVVAAARSMRGSGRWRGGTAPPCRIPRTARPSARPRRPATAAGQPAHQQRRAAPRAATAAPVRRRRKGGAQAHLEGDGHHLAHAQVGDGLLHALHPALQAVQRRVHRLHHRRGQGHVAFDQARHRRPG